MRYGRPPTSPEVVAEQSSRSCDSTDTVATLQSFTFGLFGYLYIGQMQRLQAFKFELMPRGEQQRDMRRFAGSCRFVYNKALALQIENYRAGGKFISYVAMAKRLTEWRNGPGTPWLKDSPVHPLQHALKDLERAYKNFFARRAAHPRFKKKSQRDSFRYPDPKQIKLDQANSRIFLPKLGWIRYRSSRDVLGEVRNATVSLHAGKWFVSIQTAREVEKPVPQATSAVGIDVGITRFATFSDGTFLAPLNSFKRHEARLRRAQRAMSRKTKFSTNWRKAKARVQRIHARIGNARRDYLHKATTMISKNHAMVCIEDLQVRNMSRSAAGTGESPGANVRAKSGLNKSILDQAGTSSAGSWNISWRGTGAGLSLCNRRTRAGRVRAAVRCRRRTVRRRQDSAASSADSRKTRMWSERSTFWRGDTALQPVESRCSRAAR